MVIIMLCENCGAVYDGEICPNCSGEAAKLSWGKSRGIGQLQEMWPKGEGGEPESPIFLTHCTALDFASELTVNMLEAYGIPCVRKYPNDGDFGKIIMGIGGSGVDIYVPESMYDAAVVLIEGGDDNDDAELV